MCADATLGRGLAPPGRGGVTAPIGGMPAADVIEMTLVVTTGPRTRALAVRLERATPAGQQAWRSKPSSPWLCTDIEAA